MSNVPKTRLSLLTRITDPRDSDAWNEFTTIYYPVVVETCQRRGLQHADAIDIAQEVLSRVAKCVANYDPHRRGATFRGWLYCVTRNLAVDFFRRRQQDPLATVQSASMLADVREQSEADAADFQLVYRRRIFAHAAEKVQQQVQPETWLAFERTELQAEDVATVAADLSLSPGAVYVARSRVLARLRKLIQDQLAETDHAQSD